MKRKFKITLFSCLMLSSFGTVFGQFAMYEEPLAAKSFDYKYCYCSLDYNLPNRRIPNTNLEINSPWDAGFSFTASIISQIWAEFSYRKSRAEFVKRMRREITDEVGDLLNKSYDNFWDATDDFFQEWADQGLSTAKSELSKIVNQKANDFNNVAEDLLVLDQRENEIRSGNLNNPYLGGFNIEGKSMLNLKTIDELKQLRESVLGKYHGLDNYFNQTYDVRVPPRYNFSFPSNVYEGVKLFSTEKIAVRIGAKYSKRIQNKMYYDPESAINEYRDYIMAFKSRSEKVPGFTCTLAEPFCPVDLENTLLRDGRIFNYDVEDETFNSALEQGRDKSRHMPTTRSLEDIRKSSAIPNLGKAASNYLAEHFEVKQAVDKYFENYNYNKNSQDCVNYLFQQVLGDGDFAPDTNDYKSNNTPGCRSAGTPNNAIDMEWKPNSIELGYQGFQNIMAELNNIPDNHQKIGHVIKNLLSANGKGLPEWITDVLAGEYFNFRLVPADAKGVQIDFNDGLGTDAWNDGLADNASLFGHMERVEKLAKIFGLNKSEKKALLENEKFSNKLYQFYLDNVGLSRAFQFMEDAIQTFIEGGDCDFSSFEDNNEIDTSEFTDVKLKCLFDLLKSKGNPFVQQLFNNFIGADAEWRLSLSSPTNSKNKGKVVNGVTSTNSTSKVFSINIGSRSSDIRSTLDVARTIIHETIHADVNRRRFTVSPTADDLKLRSAFDNYIKKADGGDPGHNAFVDFYLEDLAQALQDFHKMVLKDSFNQAVNNWNGDGDPRFPKGVPGLDFYRSLAWAGAGFTGVLSGDKRIAKYQALSETQKRQILDDHERNKQLTKEIKIQK